MPEVVGEAAIKVSPHDVRELAVALEKALTDQELRKSLINRGMRHAANFSWEKTAEKTLEVYKEVEESFS